MFIYHLLVISYIYQRCRIDWHFCFKCEKSRSIALNLNNLSQVFTFQNWKFMVCWSVSLHEVNKLHVTNSKHIVCDLCMHVDDKRAQNCANFKGLQAVAGLVWLMGLVQVGQFRQQWTWHLERILTNQTVALLLLGNHCIRKYC